MRDRLWRCSSAWGSPRSTSAGGGGRGPPGTGRRSTPSMAPTAPEWLIIRASRLIDGTDSLAIDRPTVVVHRGVIDAIYAGSAPRANWPAETPELDLPGHTLLPGLIDAHVHLVLPGDGTPFEDSVREPDGVLLATAHTQCANCAPRGDHDAPRLRGHARHHACAAAGAGARRGRHPPSAHGSS